ncbi:MAG: hypothetical protein HC915_20570, partial [Anaerolineae bacterium]|nr:hypothetical protein [Anaerolineae bacterium]
MSNTTYQITFYPFHQLGLNVIPMDGTKRPAPLPAGLRLPTDDPNTPTYTAPKSAPLPLEAPGLHPAPPVRSPCWPPCPGIWRRGRGRVRRRLRSCRLHRL